MLIFSDGIRLRYCDNMCFVVDITKNKIYKFDSRTIKILETFVQNGFELDNIREKNIDLFNFIHKLMKENIIVEKYDGPSTDKKLVFKE